MDLYPRLCGFYLATSSYDTCIEEVGWWSNLQQPPHCHCAYFDWAWRVGWGGNSLQTNMFWSCRCLCILKGENQGSYTFKNKRLLSSLGFIAWAIVLIWLFKPWVGCLLLMRWRICCRTCTLTSSTIPKGVQNLQMWLISWNMGKESFGTFKPIGFPCCCLANMCLLNIV